MAQESSHHLDPHPRSVLIEMTTRCNLRCTYCAVSHPAYVSHDLELNPVELIAQVERLGPHQIQLSGHGETTVLRRWTKLASSAIERGLPLSITTNLAKRLTDVEARLLSEFTHITVSCDTPDPETYAQLRRGGRLERIEENLEKLRRANARHPERRPYLAVNAVLSATTLGQLVDHVEWAAAQGAASLSLTHLVRHEALDDLAPDHAKSIPDAAATVEAATRRAKELGLDFNVMGGLAEALYEPWVDPEVPEPTPAPEPEPEPAPAPVATAAPCRPETRRCLDPWTMVYVRATGEVAPCCWSRPIGDLREDPLDRILESAEARALRRELLSGELGPDCAACPAREHTSPAELREAVARLVEEDRSGSDFALRCAVRRAERERDELRARRDEMAVAPPELEHELRTAVRRAEELSYALRKPRRARLRAGLRAVLGRTGSPT